MTIWTPSLAGRAGPLYHALADAIAEAIIDGTLPPGTRLPTHRDLAYHLGINIGTVTRAYALARDRGLVDGEVGRGTFVRAEGVAKAAAASPSFTDLALAGPAFANLHATVACFAELSATPPPPVGAPGSHSLDRIYHADDGGDDRLDLSLNYPYAPAQGAALEAGLRRCLDRVTLDAIARYQPPNGMRAHRDAGIAWLHSLGVEVEVDDLLLVAGCQSGFSIATMALARPGETVVHEALTWPGMRAAAVPLGLKLQPLAMDEQGLLPESFEAACREHRPRLLYTMPTLHNPTAIVMPESRRRAIAEIARRHGVFIIEDDVYGFLLDERPPPLRAFAPEITLYITSLSKSVAAGLRVGYVAAPRAGAAAGRGHSRQSADDIGRRCRSGERDDPLWCRHGGCGDPAAGSAPPPAYCCQRAGRTGVRDASAGVPRLAATAGAVAKRGVCRQTRRPRRRRDSRRRLRRRGTCD